MATIRDLEQSDMEQVMTICSTTWGGNDYIPEVLPNWIDSPDYIARGLFEADELMSVCTLQVVPSSKTGYISGLRTKEEHRRKGHGKEITEDLIATAQEIGVKHLLYLTMNFNEPSKKLAEQLGFSLRDQYGSFHLYTPFPSHPTPSPDLIPINASPERVTEVTRSFASLVPNHYIPFDFHFYGKSLDNFRHISASSDFHLVTDENGHPGGLYYSAPLRDDRGERATSYIVYTTNQSIFVDMMARILDEIPERGATRVTFLMGPNATEWVTGLRYTDSEMGAWPGVYSERRLLLYELELWKRGINTCAD
ncbi:MAG: GNAT family N-acetyltransferase [Candidatus Thorarchaeota archaeon]